jgi:hypothetical protein
MPCDKFLREQILLLLDTVDNWPIRTVRGAGYAVDDRFAKAES